MKSERPIEDALIVGAGPIGLACAISARRHGQDPLVIDAGAIANSIVHYPVGMRFFTTPERLEIGDHPLVSSGPKATREEALKYYRGVARAERLRIRTYTELTGITRDGETITATVRHRLGQDTVRCRRLVLATGYFDHPNRLDVPGEELPHVRHYFDEAHTSYGLEVVVVGGKNSAIEAALELFRAGARVTTVIRQADLSASVKYWLRPDFQNRLAAGEITAHWESEVRSIDERTVTVGHADGSEHRVPADRVYALIGFHPDFDLFERIGITFDDETGRPTLNAETLETNVPGVYLAGSVAGGRRISEVFIENGRFDGEKIFGDQAARANADERYASSHRPRGE